MNSNNKYRNKYCGEITIEDAGKTVRIGGWINSIRNLGSLVFLTVRDESGVVQVISEESERLTRLINDVLDLSKIEAGKMTFYIKEEKLADVISRAVKNMTGFSDSKNISISQIISDESLMVLIDKDRILQVLANLINNAVKFTPEDGTIEVEIKKDDEKFAMVIVKDNGIGIKPEDHAAIFEKFKQSEDIMVRSAGGTGLGLSICKNIVEHFGGKIWVESEYGHGSSFIFTLPLSQNTNNSEES